MLLLKAMMLNGWHYSFPPLLIQNMTAEKNSVRLNFNDITGGDSSTYVDFSVKINGVAGTITSLSHTNDAPPAIVLTITETILPDQSINLTYTPHRDRHIEAPYWAPISMVYAFKDSEVVNNVVYYNPTITSSYISATEPSLFYVETNQIMTEPSGAIFTIKVDGEGDIRDSDTSTYTIDTSTLFGFNL